MKLFQYKPPKMFAIMTVLMYMEKSIKTCSILFLQIWDTGGQETLESKLKSFKKIWGNQN